MDPLAERTPEVSPYVYCKDNPVNAIDLNGDTIRYENTINNIYVRAMSTISDLNSKSSIFNNLYNTLESLPVMITIHVDDAKINSSYQTASGGSSDKSDGYTSANGKDVYLSSSARLTAYPEELFHSYQKYMYEPNSRQVNENEVEAKLFASVTVFESLNSTNWSRGLVPVKKSIEQCEEPYYQFYFLAPRFVYIYANSLYIANPNLDYLQSMENFNSYHLRATDPYHGTVINSTPILYNKIIKIF